MLGLIKKHPYITGGIVVFLFLFFLGIFALDVTWSESLLGSAVISVIGAGGYWWKTEVWP